MKHTKQLVDLRSGNVLDLTEKVIKIRNKNLCAMYDIYEASVRCLTYEHLHPKMFTARKWPPFLRLHRKRIDLVKKLLKSYGYEIL